MPHSLYNIVLRNIKKMKQKKAFICTALIIFFSITQCVWPDEIDTASDLGFSIGASVGTPGIINCNIGSELNEYFNFYGSASILQALLSHGDDKTKNDDNDPCLILLQANLDFKMINFKYFKIYPGLAVGALFFSDENSLSGALYAGPVLDIFIWKIFLEGGIAGIIGGTTSTPPYTYKGMFPLIQIGYFQKI